jgi:hypothetical protein
MTYDISDLHSGNIPPWHGATIVYGRAWMILDHLRKNGFVPDCKTDFKVKTLINADMAILISALEGGDEARVRQSVTSNLRFLTVQQLAETSR